MGFVHQLSSTELITTTTSTTAADEEYLSLAPTLDTMPTSTIVYKQNVDHYGM